MTYNIMELIDAVIGIPVFTNPYWSNAFLMAKYTAGMYVLYMVIDRVMALFGWTGRILRGKFNERR